MLVRSCLHKVVCCRESPGFEPSPNPSSAGSTKLSPTLCNGDSLGAIVWEVSWSDRPIVSEGQTDLSHGRYGRSMEARPRRKVDGEAGLGEHAAPLDVKAVVEVVRVLLSDPVSRMIGNICPMVVYSEVGV